MNCIVVGLGIQGKKRQRIAGNEVVATVDPKLPEATYQRVEDVPLESFEAALCCVPDNPKPQLLEYLLENKKNVLVEKPLLGRSRTDLKELSKLAEEKHVVCYTAYNHRFEPHLVTTRQILLSGELGKIYQANLLT